jgi:ribonuclease P protein component
MKYSYNKFEKLKSKKLIEQLFLEGKTVTHYPLRLTFIETSFDNDVKFKAGVSVSKRNFKKAVDRNKIKRLLREAYRLNKSMIFNNITTQNAFMILYLGNEIPNFKDLEIKMKQLFEKYLTKVSKQ